MKYLIILIVAIISESAFSQKRAIDTSAFRTWPSVGQVGISRDGKYVFYVTGNGSANAETLVVTGVGKIWRMEFIGGRSPVFSRDSRYLVFKSSRDSLCLLILGSDESKIIPNVVDYKLIDQGKDLWLAYLERGPSKVLVVQNLNDVRKFQWSSISRYDFFDRGRSILLESDSIHDGKISPALKTVDLYHGDIKTIWIGDSDGESVARYAYNADRRQMAYFVAKKSTDKMHYSLWYFKTGMGVAVKLVGDTILGLSQDYGLSDELLEFDRQKDRVIFKVGSPRIRSQKPLSTMVDVWSYKDTLLQSDQLNETLYTPSYTAVVNIGQNTVIRVEREHEWMLSHHGNYALVRHSWGISGLYESYWNKANQPSYWLVSLEDGSRKLLREHLTDNDMVIELSPGGNWIVYYNLKLGNYYSYEIATGETRSITRKYKAAWTRSASELPNPVAWRVMRWLPGEKGLLLKSDFDIWKFDLQGKTPPINLTNGYGAKHKIEFGFLDNDDTLRLGMGQGNTLTIRAFNTLTKEMGFYKIGLGLAANPQLLTMGEYIYGFMRGHEAIDQPIKAEDTSVYLVAKMSASESPNYTITNDFKQFTAITDVHPERGYNWLTTELLHWEGPDRRMHIAILYKPKDFNPIKKYPVIFDFYEVRSDELNLFIRPEASTSRINIPWYVSNGYLVCVPDIHYKIGEPGPSACNAVILAAEHLAKMPWVDAHRMGIQGHSFGGYEVNYIITHSHLFAAACSASGVSDLISSYGSLSQNGGFSQYHEEHQQGRMGGTPWSNTSLYIKNSPIFKVGQVTTPILLMNNKSDPLVSFSQGVEFFTALRRLGKRAWMLQYDHGSHAVFGQDAMDFTIRMRQFFDHYLKDAPTPKWMLDGVPANMKGIENGLQLDRTGRSPGPGLDKRN